MEQSRVLYEAHAGVLVARVHAIAYPHNAPRLFERLAAEAADRSLNRILIDFRGLVGALARSDNAAIGRMAALYLPDCVCAMLIQEERRTGVASQAAREAGMNCQGFSDEAEAMQWLRSTATPRPVTELQP